MSKQTFNLKEANKEIPVAEFNNDEQMYELPV